MKESFTLEDIERIVEKAIEKTKMEESGCNVITAELNKAWNRGADCTGSHVLLIANELKWGRF